MTKIMFGAMLDLELIEKARANMQQRMSIPLSNAAMIRVLVGLMADGKVDVITEDIARYSMETFNKGGFAIKRK